MHYIFVNYFVNIWIVFFGYFEKMDGVFFSLSIEAYAYFYKKIVNAMLWFDLFFSK